MCFHAKEKDIYDTVVIDTILTKPIVDIIYSSTYVRNVRHRSVHNIPYVRTIIDFQNFRLVTIHYTISRTYSTYMRIHL